MRALTDPWTLGGHRLTNRVVLAPLAGIGNWFVRLQAKRFGAGLALGDGVELRACHGNRRTVDEFLRIHPDEHPVSLQLFGQDPEVMRRAAAMAAEAGADLIDLNMGCPVPKVCKTGAGAALLRDPDRAVAIARAAAEGTGLPVTVKLRPGRARRSRRARAGAPACGRGGRGGHRLPPAPCVPAALRPPDYALARELVEALHVPVVLSGGLSSDEGGARLRGERRRRHHARARLVRKPLALRTPAGQLPGRRARRGDRRSSTG